VTGWRPPEDDEELDAAARATNSLVGVGEANTEPTAANAATVVKVFIVQKRVIARDTGSTRAGFLCGCGDVEVG